MDCALWEKDIVRLKFQPLEWERIGNRDAADTVLMRRSCCSSVATYLSGGRTGGWPVSTDPEGEGYAMMEAENGTMHLPGKEAEDHHQPSGARKRHSRDPPQVVEATRPPGP